VIHISLGAAHPRCSESPSLASGSPSTSVSTADSKPSRGASRCSTRAPSERKPGAGGMASPSISSAGLAPGLPAPAAGMAPLAVATVRRHRCCPPSPLPPPPSPCVLMALCRPLMLLPGFTLPLKT
jgi:hypothetical protein